MVIKTEAEPTVYAGMEMAVSDDRKRRTLRMEQKVIETVREHLPELLDGDKEKLAARKLLKGKALRDALDRLTLEPKPDGEQARAGVMSGRERAS